MTSTFGNASNSTFTLRMMSSSTTTFFAPVQLDVPLLKGGAQPEWSTCTDLAVDPGVINDVNGYYRALGFAFPFREISKKDLREAYRDLRGAEGSAHRRDFMTYALKMLVNGSFRRFYNRAPVGSIYVDRYQFKTRLKAARKYAEGIVKGRPYLDVEDVIEQFLIENNVPFRRRRSNEPIGASEQPFTDTDDHSDVPAEQPDSVPETWSAGYYTWRSSRSDTQALAVWARLLTEAARAQDCTLRLAIGFVGATRREWVVMPLGGSIAVLLNEFVEPDQHLAASAVHEVINMMQP